MTDKVIKHKATTLNNSYDYDIGKSAFPSTTKGSISEADEFTNAAKIKFMNLTMNYDGNRLKKVAAVRFEDKALNERKATRDEILNRFKQNINNLTCGGRDFTGLSKSTADGSYLSKTLNNSKMNNPKLSGIFRSTFDSPSKINTSEATSNCRPKDERLWGLVQNF